MKQQQIVGVTEAQKQLCRLIEESQEQSVLITSHGKPVAVLKGIRGTDLATAVRDLGRRASERRK